MATYTAESHIAFSASDGISTSVDLEYGVSDDTEYPSGLALSHQEYGYFEQPNLWNPFGTTSIEYSETFDLSPYGGCDTAFISFQGVSADGGNAGTEHSPQMCWASRMCNLYVDADSGGSVTQTDASGDYPCNACVELFAIPNNGWQFDGWTGDVVSTANIVTICMNDQERSVTAHFSLYQPPDDGSDNECGAPPDYQGQCTSPIVIDLGQGSYALTGLANGVTFDINADGSPDRVGWTAPGTNEAFLTIDRNGNGIVDNGAELFGNRTPLPDGKIASNGFAALAAYDSNGDGVIDQRDLVWLSLRLWVDANHDGVSQPDELSTLDTAGITELGLRAQPVGRRDGFGNFFRYQAELRQGTHRKVYYDIYFVTAP